MNLAGPGTPGYEACGRVRSFFGPEYSIGEQSREPRDDCNRQKPTLRRDHAVLLA